MTPATLRALLAARRGGRPVILATRLFDGQQVLLPDGAPHDALREAAAACLSSDESRLIELGGESWFLQVHAPAHRLIVVGAVHVAQSLAPLAAAIGYQVIIVDPRRSFATTDRFPGVALVDAWPDEALRALGPDARTAVVALTHDAKLDDPALDAALASEAFYLGALGSRKTHAARLERLALLGHSATSLMRIRGPVGLALAAVTAPEIALSILAEIVAVRRGAAIAHRA